MSLDSSERANLNIAGTNYLNCSSYLSLYYSLSYISRKIDHIVLDKLYLNMPSTTFISYIVNDLQLISSLHQLYWKSNVTCPLVNVLGAWSLKEWLLLSRELLPAENGFSLLYPVKVQHTGHKFWITIEIHISTTFKQHSISNYAT